MTKVQIIIGIIAVAVALWGAVLSTCNTYYLYRSKRPQVIVNSTIELKQEKGAVFVEAINSGERSVYLKKWWIETTIAKTSGARFLHNLKMRFVRRRLADAISSESFIISSSSFPVVLEPGRLCELVLDEEAILASLADGPWNELAVLFEDETGRLYASHRMPFQRNQIRFR